MKNFWIDYSKGQDKITVIKNIAKSLNIPLRDAHHFYETEIKNYV